MMNNKDNRSASDESKGYKRQKRRRKCITFNKSFSKQVPKKIRPILKSYNSDTNCFENEKTVRKFPKK